MHTLDIIMTRILYMHITSGVMILTVHVVRVERLPPCTTPEGVSTTPQAVHNTNFLNNVFFLSQTCSDKANT